MTARTALEVEPASGQAGELAEVMNDLLPAVALTVTQTSWAQDEVLLAQRRHGECGRGRIWDGFSLLRPTHEGMAVELVYRAHCRELLDRIAASTDTRLGTIAEVILALRHVSSVAPMNGPATGLYMRLFQMAFPREFRRVFRDVPRRSGDYERMYGERIDEFEHLARRKLTQPWRRLTPPSAVPSAAIGQMRRPQNVSPDRVNAFVRALRDLCTRFTAGA